jgi:hypothetical protein
LPGVGRFQETYLLEKSNSDNTVLGVMRKRWRECHGMLSTNEGFTEEATVWADVLLAERRGREAQAKARKDGRRV